MEFIFTRDVPPAVALPMLDEFQQDFGEGDPQFTAPGTMLGEAFRLITAAQRTQELAQDIPAYELVWHFHRIMSAYALNDQGSIEQRASMAWRLFAHGAAGVRRARASRDNYAIFSE